MTGHGNLSGTVPGVGAYHLIWDVQNSQWRRAAAARVDGGSIARNNIAAVNGHRNMMKNDAALSSSLEKLSTAKDRD